MWKETSCVEVHLSKHIFCVLAVWVTHKHSDNSSQKIARSHDFWSHGGGKDESEETDVFLVAPLIHLTLGYLGLRGCTIFVFILFIIVFVHVHGFSCWAQNHPETNTQILFIHWLPSPAIANLDRITCCHLAFPGFRATHKIQVSKCFESWWGSPWQNLLSVQWNLSSWINEWIFNRHGPKYYALIWNGEYLDNQVEFALENSVTSESYPDLEKFSQIYSR